MTDKRSAAKDAVLKNRKSVSEHWSNAKYTRSIVAFIDVMGTKKLLLENPDDFDKHKTIFKIWNEIEQRIHQPEYRERIDELYGDFPIKSTLMSDGVVLSIDINVPDAFSYLFMEMGSFIYSLFSLCPPHFARGAVTIGNLYHEDNIVFGPALVEAHLLEKNIAKNFRFIIRKSDFDEAQDFVGDNLKNFPMVYFPLDNDGYYTFDYLYRFFGAIDNWIEGGENPDLYLNILNRIQKTAKYEAANNKDKGVRKKYMWMQKYFKRTLTQVLLNSDKDEYIWLKDAYEDWKKRDKN